MKKIIDRKVYNLCPTVSGWAAPLSNIRRGSLRYSESFAGPGISNHQQNL